VAELTKQAEEKAYRAGASLLTVIWPEDTPADTSVGLHHCPFSEGDPQRAAWLRGLKDALKKREDEEKARRSTLAAIDKELA
jgi:hypothetical protein